MCILVLTFSIGGVTIDGFAGGPLIEPESVKCRPVDRETTILSSFNIRRKLGFQPITLDSRCPETLVGHLAAGVSNSNGNSK